jgi:hypothetical protein
MIGSPNGRGTSGPGVTADTVAGTGERWEHVRSERSRRVPQRGRRASGRAPGDDGRCRPYPRFFPPGAVSRVLNDHRSGRSRISGTGGTRRRGRWRPGDRRRSASSRSIPPRTGRRARWPASRSRPGGGVLRLRGKREDGHAGDRVGCPRPARGAERRRHHRHGGAVRYRRSPVIAGPGVPVVSSRTTSRRT